MSTEKIDQAWPVRLALTVALLVMVYRETGPWTTIALGLVSLQAEVATLYMKRRLSRG